MEVKEYAVAELEAYGLDTATIGALEALGICWLSHLLEYTFNELGTLSGVGNRRRNRIMQAIRSHRLDNRW